MLKDLDDIINGINKLDNISLVSIFQVPLHQSRTASTSTITCSTSERQRILEQHQNFLEGLVEDQITRNLSTVEAIASEIDVTMSQLEEKVEFLPAHQKKRLIVLLENKKDHRSSSFSNFGGRLSHQGSSSGSYTISRLQHSNEDEPEIEEIDDFVFSSSLHQYQTQRKIGIKS